MKSIIIFDLDDTLAVSKRALSDEMAEALASLLKKYKVAIISGAAFTQFQKQVISRLPSNEGGEEILPHLYIFPTNGSSLYVFEHGAWKAQYSEPLSEEQKKKIIDVIEKTVKEAGVTVEKIYGQQIEDRDNQITFSGVGQEAPVEAKKSFDPDQKIRLALAQKMQPLLPEFEIKIGGMTSIDITRKGVDKAYAIQKIETTLSIAKSDMLFVGDALFPGGNDYAVKEAGVESIKVDSPADTLKVIHQLLTV